MTDEPRRNMKKLAAALGIAAALALGACSAKSVEPFKDAPVADRDASPADIHTMPDGFSNFASKCVGPNRVFTAFKGDENRASIAVAPDPSCR